MKTIDREGLLGLISRSAEGGAGVAFAIDSYSNVYVVPRDNLNASYDDPHCGWRTCLPSADFSVLNIDGEKVKGKTEVYWLGDLMAHATLRNGAEIFRVSPEVSISELENFDVEFSYGWERPLSLAMTLHFIGSSYRIRTTIPISDVKVESEDVTFKEIGRCLKLWSDFECLYEVVLVCRKVTTFLWRGGRYSVSYKNENHLQSNRAMLPPIDEEVVKRVSLQKGPILYRLNRDGFSRAERISCEWMTREEYEDPGDWNDDFRCGHFRKVQYPVNEKWSEFIPVSADEVRQVLGGEFNACFSHKYFEAYRFSSEHEKFKSLHEENKQSYRELREKVDTMKRKLSGTPFFCPEKPHPHSPKIR